MTYAFQNFGLVLSSVFLCLETLMKHLSSFILQNIASFTIGQVLGERLKYSCCLWSEGATNLEGGVMDLIWLICILVIDMCCRTVTINFDSVTADLLVNIVLKSCVIS